MCLLQWVGVNENERTGWCIWRSWYAILFIYTNIALARISRYVKTIWNMQLFSHIVAEGFTCTTERYCQNRYGEAIAKSKFDVQKICIKSLDCRAIDYSITFGRLCSSTVSLAELIHGDRKHPRWEQCVLKRGNTTIDYVRLGVPSGQFDYTDFEIYLGGFH